MKKSGCFGLVLGLIVLGFLGEAQAQDKYPSRPIEESVRYRMVPGTYVSLSISARHQELLKLSEHTRRLGTASQCLQIQVFLLHHQYTSSIAQMFV